MKYTKKVPYFKKGDKFDKIFKKLPKEQKEAILKINSAQKEQERKDKLSSVGAGFKRPATSAINMPVDTRSAQIENTVGQTAARTFGEAFQQARERGDSEFPWQGERFHTRTAEEEAERKAQESKTTVVNTNVGNTNVGNTNVENTNVENTPAKTNAQTSGDSLSRINLPGMTDTRSPEQIEEQTKLDQAAAARVAASNVDASSRESNSTQFGGNPINTGSNTSYPIIEPRRNSFMGNITARSTTPIVTITGADGRVWQGNRYRNLGPAQFAELKSGQDTLSRRILNNEHYFTVNNKEIRNPDLYIIDLFDNLDYEDSKAMAQEKEKIAIAMEHLRKYPDALGKQKGLGGYRARFQQGGQMPQEGSQEELVLDFAVRYLVTMGVPEEDIMDPQGNLNPEHQQELEQVFNSQEIDWSDYAASPDEYMQQFIGNLQAQAQMARKGAKLKRLSQVKAHFYGGPIMASPAALTPEMRAQHDWPARGANAPTPEMSPQVAPRIRDQYNRPGRGENVLPTPEMRAQHSQAQVQRQEQGQGQVQRQRQSLWDSNKKVFNSIINPHIQRADSVYNAKKDALIDGYNNLEETGEKAGARIGRFAGRAIKEIPRAAAALSHPLAMPAMAVNRARNNWLQRREEKKNPPIYF